MTHADPTLAALRAALGPGRLVVVHRSRLLLRAGACRAVAVARDHSGAWVVIALAGLWLGLLGVAMATGLAMVMRTGAEIPEDYWVRAIGNRDYVKSDAGEAPRAQLGDEVTDLPIARICVVAERDRVCAVLLLLSYPAS